MFHVQDVHYYSLAYLVVPIMEDQISLLQEPKIIHFEFEGSVCYLCSKWISRAKFLTFPGDRGQQGSSNDNGVAPSLLSSVEYCLLSNFSLPYLQVVISHQNGENLFLSRHSSKLG